MGRSYVGAPRRSRALSVSLIAASTLLAAGCGGSGSGNGASDPRPTANNDEELASLQIGEPTDALCESGKTYTIGYDTWSDTEAFTKILNDAQKALAAELGCVEIVQLVDNADPALAIQNAKVLVQKDVDAALLLNVVAAVAPAQTKLFQDADIPVVTLLTKVDGVHFATTDEKLAGNQAGEGVAEAFKSKYPDETPYVIVGRWDQSGQNGIDRMDGVTEAIKAAFPDLPSDHVINVDTKGDAPAAQAATLGVLNSIPKDAKIILSSQNDPLTFALVQAARQADRQDNVVAVGIGGARPDGLNFVCSNPEYSGVVGFFPEKWPNYTVPMLLAMVEGETVPEDVIIATEYISRDSIEEFYPDFKCGEKAS